MSRRRNRTPKERAQPPAQPKPKLAAVEEKAPEPTPTPPPVEPPPLREEKGEIAQLEDGLEDYGIVFTRNPETFEAGKAKPLLKLLLEAQTDGRQVTAGELAKLTQDLRDAGLELADAEPAQEPEPEPEAGEPAEREEVAAEPPATLEFGPTPELPPSYALAPLAQGILIYDAMLTEAKAGYITGRVEELEDVLGQEFDPEEKSEIFAFASQWKDEAGLPDVGGGYQQAILSRDGR